MDQLERLSLLSKICQELDNHLGVGDKVLAEYLLSLYDEAAVRIQMRLIDYYAPWLTY